MSDHLDRRDLLKLGAAGLSLAAVGSVLACRDDGVHRTARPSLGAAPDEPFRAPPMDVVRIGFVGVGLQGGAHVQNFLKIDGVEISAICDIDEPRLNEVVGWVEADGRPRPTAYGQGDTDFVRMCETEELDLVFTATPWEWHVPVCTAAMENEKHVATEVPAAYTVDDCWKLVEWAEHYQKHCVMMENVNYGPAEMMVLNMVRQGLLRRDPPRRGRLPARPSGHQVRGRNEGLWRRAHSMDRNGNSLPDARPRADRQRAWTSTAAIASTHLVSMSGPSRGLQEWAREHYSGAIPKRRNATSWATST